ncbi:hypothetical protein CEXT_81221 [Caerostris extrusa]|uniref:Uncharacterized protein n=1 Tax=Caerostris extrusa TaxID=172846 RepID=A0AAV4MFT6_CAEEX|nr:hypothetical protein CEXT_81221 [Caerostris extrusa]
MTMGFVLLSLDLKGSLDLTKLKYINKEMCSIRFKHTRLQRCEIWNAQQESSESPNHSALSYKQKKKTAYRFRSHISPLVARHYERNAFLRDVRIAVSFDSGHDTRAWLIGLRHVILGVQQVDYAT